MAGKAKKAPEKSVFEVKDEGWVAGRRRLKGDLVELTQAQAKYENVKPASARKVAAAKSETGKEAAKT